MAEKDEIQATKSKTPRLTKDVGGHAKGSMVEVLKTYEDTGHHRIRVDVGDGEMSKDIVVGPNDIA